MRTVQIQSLTLCSIILGATLFTACDQPPTQEAVAPIRTADPIGRKLTHLEHQLPASAMTSLRRHFPGYQLPLSQDQNSRQLKNAIEENDLKSIESLIQNGADVNWRLPYDNPPLFDAIKQNRIEIAQRLIENGAAITPKKSSRYGIADPCLNIWGQTPLYYAARLGRLEIVKQLASAGADVNAYCTSGNTALNGALEGQHPAVVRYLLSQKTNADFERIVEIRPTANTVLHGNDKSWQEAPFRRTANSLADNLANWIRADVDAQISKQIQRMRSAWLDNTAERMSEQIRWAVLYNDAATLKMLIARGADPHAFYYQSNLLHDAASRGHVEIAKILLKTGIDVNERTRGNVPETAIECCVRSGNVAMMQLLREHGATLPKDGSLLRRAVAYQHREMVRYLISAGDSVDTDDIVEMSLASKPSYRTGNPSGSLAKKVNVTTIHEMLVQAGATIPVGHSANENHTMPIEYRIASLGHLDHLKWLQKQRPVLYDDQLLRHAMESGNLELCRHAVAQGAKFVPDATRDQDLLRRVLVRFRDPELVEFLFDQGVKKQYPSQFEITGYSSFDEYGHPLYHAALVGDIDFCRYLIRTFPDGDLTRPLQYDPYEYDSDIEYFGRGNSILVAPLFGDHYEILELLLTHSFPKTQGTDPIDVNAKNAVGSTPLHTAVNYASSRCVQLLLASGANPLAVRDGYENADRRTPCHQAIHQTFAAHHHATWPIEPDRLIMFPMLVSTAMANDEQWLSHTTHSGRTILHEYAYAGSIEACEKLIQLGADLNTVDKHDQTPLNLAFRGFSKYTPSSDSIQYTRLCSLLIDHGTTLKRPTAPDGLDYFHSAITHGLFPFAELLLENGYEPEIENHSGPLLAASAQKGNTKFLSWLIENGASINATDYAGKTALHHAVESGKIELCEMVIKAGANINAQDQDGNTALFGVFNRYASHTQKFISPNPFSTRKEKFQILTLLLDSGADPSLRSRYGRTVLEQFPSMPPEFRKAITAASKTDSQSESPSASRDGQPF